MIGRYRATALVSAGFLAAAFFGGAVLNHSAEAQRPLSGERLSNGAPMSFADLIERVSPAVVSINVRTKSASALGPDFDFEGAPEEFRDFFDRFRDSPPQEGRALGSGFFISADGHVVTNYHVVANASTVTVILPDGDEYDAEILGVDESTDLAVLRVDSDGRFPYVAFAEQPDLRVGDWVVAVGNPFGLGGTATAGIISATGREIGGRYNDFIQIDAPINSGNSGGPTFDLRGRVVGVNSQIYSPSGGNVGIGFAIPSDVASRIVNELIENGEVVRGWLGVTIQAVTADMAASVGLDDAAGAMVASVVAGGPADDAGFQERDIVLEVDGEHIDDALDLTRTVGRLIAGSDAEFRVYRDGEVRRIAAHIGERPGDEELASAPRVQDGDKEGGWFGMSLLPLDEDVRNRLGLATNEDGVLISDVESSSEAADKGLRDGEVILQVGGEEVTSVADFERAVALAEEDGREAVLLTVFDGSRRRFVALRFDGEEGAG